MYNGGNNYTNGGDTYTKIGTFRIKNTYLYIAAAVGAVLALLMIFSFVTNVLDTNLIIHFGMIAGVLLLITNIREQMNSAHAHRSGTALSNTLIGASLVGAWFSQVISSLFWLPALLLILLAAPLALGRASTYTKYAEIGNAALSNMRRVVNRQMANRS